MNEKALRDLTYGLFLIGTKYEEKENACIVNTVIQAASSPTRIIFAGINGNLTGELIRKSGFFPVTVLDESAEYPLFENFGMRHGRDTDKMKKEGNANEQIQRPEDRGRHVYQEGTGGISDRPGRPEHHL